MTRMRLAASALSCSAMFTILIPGADAKQMADGAAELGPVERVEMELANAARIKLGAKLGGHGGGDELARGRKIVQPLERPPDPGRHRGAVHRGHPAGRGEIGDGHDSRQDLDVDPGGGNLVAIAEEAVGIEE